MAAIFFLSQWVDYDQNNTGLLRFYHVLRVIYTEWVYIKDEYLHL